VSIRCYHRAPAVVLEVYDGRLYVGTRGSPRGGLYEYTGNCFSRISGYLAQPPKEQYELSQSSEVFSIVEMIPFDNALYFSGRYLSTSGADVWGLCKYDGTSISTIKDFNGSGLHVGLRNFSVLNSELYFLADVAPTGKGTHDWQLWKLSANGQDDCVPEYSPSRSPLRARKRR